MTTIKSVNMTMTMMRLILTMIAVVILFILWPLAWPFPPQLLETSASRPCIQRACSRAKVFVMRISYRLTVSQLKGSSTQYSFAR